MFRYLDEQVFRYNNLATEKNPMGGTDRFQLALSQVARKRLILAVVTGKVGTTSPTQNRHSPASLIDQGAVPSFRRGCRLR